MGKGFNNYMCKKFFHPASRDNLKRVWMAEQKSEAYRKRQDELRMQYEKEQDLYNNRALLSKESKDKLSVNFLYEPPPGAKKEREREDDEPEYKFEWQRKYNAPREDYCKNNSEIRDQPFGILVRNVRCIKCHKWGHINTDRECPLFNQTPGTSEEQDPIDAQSLVQQMRDDGLALKKSAMSAQQHIQFPSQNMIDSDEDEEGTNKIQADEIEFLKNLSTKQKQKLLRKLEKLEKKNREKKKKKAKKNGKRDTNGNTSESDSSYEEKSKTRKKVTQTDKERKSSSGQESDNYKDKRKVYDKKKGEERSNGNAMKVSRREQIESHSQEFGSNHVRNQSPSSKKIKRERRNSDVDCEPSYRERRSRSVENRIEPRLREYSINHNQRQSPNPERPKIKQERRDTDSDSDSSCRKKGSDARLHIRSSNHKSGRSSSPLRKRVQRDQRGSDTDSEPTYKGRRRSRSMDKSRDKRRNDHAEIKRRRRSTSRDHR